MRLRSQWIKYHNATNIFNLRWDLQCRFHFDKEMTMFKVTLNFKRVETSS